MQKKRMKEILNTETGNFMLFGREIVHNILKIFVLVNRHFQQTKSFFETKYCRINEKCADI